MDEFESLQKRYNEEQQSENRFLYLQEKIEKKRRYNLWIFKTISLRFFIIPSLFFLLLFFKLDLVIICVFFLLYHIFHIFIWTDFVVMTPSGYPSGLKGRYDSIVDRKLVPYQKVVTEKQQYRALKQDEKKRKEFIELYERLKNDKEFREIYFNVGKE